MGRKKIEGRRWMEGGDDLTCDTTFPSSSVLAHPLRYNRTRHWAIKGREILTFIAGGHLGFDDLILIS